MTCTPRILDETAMERIIRGFREEELQLPGFMLADVERQANALVWRFTHCPEWATLMPEFYAEFDGAKVIQFNWGNPIKLRPGDMFHLTYTLNWSENGGGGDHHVGLPPTTGHGKEIPLTIWSTCA